MFVTVNVTVLCNRYIYSYKHCRQLLYLILYMTIPNSAAFFFFLLNTILQPNLIPVVYASDHTNILFILADDLGYGDLSVAPFNKLKCVKTPHLQAMADKGDDVYVN